MNTEDSRGPKKRSRKRRMVTEQITLTGIEPGKEREPMKCLTINVSDSGVGIYAEDALASGSAFTVHCGKLWDLPRQGVVKWCRKLAEGLYRAGMEVAAPGPQFSCGEEHADFNGGEPEGGSR